MRRHKPWCHYLDGGYFCSCGAAWDRRLERLEQERKQARIAAWLMVVVAALVAALTVLVVVLT